MRKKPGIPVFPRIENGVLVFDHPEQWFYYQKDAGVLPAGDYWLANVLHDIGSESGARCLQLELINADSDSWTMLVWFPPRYIRFDSDAPF